MERVCGELVFKKLFGSPRSEREVFREKKGVEIESKKTNSR